MTSRIVVDDEFDVYNERTSIGQKKRNVANRCRVVVVDVYVFVSVSFYTHTYCHCPRIVWNLIEPVDAKKNRGEGKGKTHRKENNFNNATTMIQFRLINYYYLNVNTEFHRTVLN